MSESWQNWDSEDYQEFLEHFYRMQLKIAMRTTKDAIPDDFVAYTVAVFEKIAPPAVYLKAEYDAWKLKKRTQVKHPAESFRGDSKTVDTSFVEPPQDKWTETKTVGTYRCSERDATDEELRKAKDVKDRSMWYSPPGNGYRWGLVFKKVKP